MRHLRHGPSIGIGLGLPLGAQRGDGSILALDLLNTNTAPIGTYTRATGGYTFNSAGVLVANSANLPRPDYDPATLTKRGWLMEGLRQNLLLYSEDLTQANWTKTRVLAFGSGSVSNATTAPDGASTADKVVEDTTASNDHYVQQNYTKAASAIAYSFSIHVKAAERSRVYIAAYGSAFTERADAKFNVSTGTVATAAAVAGTFTAASAQIQDCGNGWYRCVLSFTTDTHTVISCRVGLENGSTAYYTGDGASGIYLWAAQLEAATFPSSYIPTTTASASRSADLWTISNAQFLAATGQNIPQEGTVYCEFAYAGGSSAKGAYTRTSIAIDNGTTGTSIAIYNSSGYPAGVVYSGGGAPQAEMVPIVTADLAVGAIVRSAVTYKANDFQAWTNGGHGTRDVAGTSPTVDRIAIGSYSTGGNPGFIWLRRVIIYPFHTPLDATGDRMTA